MISLENKTILVTGSTSGIGSAVAGLCIQLGAKLIVTGRNAGRLEALKQAHGDAILQSIAADLTKPTDLESLAKNCPPLDGVVHSAGVIYPMPVKFIKQRHLDETMAINYTAPATLTAALFKHKKINAGASLVFISSVSTRFPYFGGSPYVASKAALEAFSLNLALEYADQKIRSNAVSPGLVKTAIFEKTGSLAAIVSGHESDNNSLLAHEQEYPLGFGEPIDVANAICFLLSPAARWITGQNIVMDGGLTLPKKK